MIKLFRCTHCEHKSCPCTEGIIANDNDLGNIITLPSLDVLRSPYFASRLAIAFVNMSRPRRSVIDWLWDRFLEFDGVALTNDRRFIALTDIDLDSVFDTDGDPSLRWVTSFMHFAETPPRQRTQLRTVERLACLYIGIAIAYPDVAAHLT